MNPLLDFLVTNWCPAALLGVALAVLVAMGLLRRRNIRWFRPLLGASCLLVVASIGGLVLPPRWGGLLLVSAFAGLVGLFLVLAVSGSWWRWPAYGVALLALSAPVDCG